MDEFQISAGTSVSFGTMNNTSWPTSWTQIAAATEIPEIGGEPETVESTTLDNLKFRTYVKGLQDLGTLTIPFNLQHPSATANINVVAGLDEDTSYAWKIEYSSGISVKFTSKPSYSFNPVGVNEIESFNLYLTPEDEPEIDIPVQSV